MRRICSSTSTERFCASSMTSTTVRPPLFSSSRKSFSAWCSSRSSEPAGESPNSALISLSSPKGEMVGLKMSAVRCVAGSSWFSRVRTMVVLPVPTSPESSMKPARLSMAKSRCANASWCGALRKRKAGFGVRANGGSLKPKYSQYIARHGARWGRKRLEEENATSYSYLRRVCQVNLDGRRKLLGELHDLVQSLTFFRPNWLGGHCLAAMSGRIELGQALFQGWRRIVDRSNDDPPVLHRNSNLLINLQVSSARH